MKTKIIAPKLLPYQYWHLLNFAQKSQTKMPRGRKFKNAVKVIKPSFCVVKNASRFRSKPFNKSVFRITYFDEISDFLDDVEVQDGSVK